MDRGLEDRRLFAQANPDGTANLLGLQLSPQTVTAISRRINGIALHLNKTDESRAIDQIRADVFTDLLMGETITSSGRGGCVDITVDLQTLAELSEAPGDLAGYGPVIADIARQVVATPITRLVSFRDAKCRQPIATSTIALRGRKVVPHRSRTTDRCADTTTWADIARVGNT